MKRTLLLIIIAKLSLFSFAGEGMWIPLLLENHTIDEMKEEGFRLDAEDIYSINQSSMKDAVMIFGGGCTAELISDQGLIITNHHCGYSQIQQHSTIENDYLTDGFWAMSKEEELPNPDLEVTFLKRMEDVTDRVLKGVEDDMTMTEREEIIEDNIENIKEEETEGTHYGARVEPFYHGNQYFLFINETYKDVRLVGAPPSAIGKFGGNTDNWMWPRHTGDFSLFRIYADENNEPAGYSKDNQPYEPRKHFPISLEGLEENDFTMVFGYPGSTHQYAPSYHLEMLKNKVYPKLIKMRTRKLNTMDHYIEDDPEVRIQYSAKRARVSNSWKRWQGEIRGLEQLNAISKKKEFEESFREWVQTDAQRKESYGGLLGAYEEVYNQLGDVRLARDLLLEIIYRNGTEAPRAASLFEPLTDLYENEKNPDPQKVDSLISVIRKETNDFFKDYHQPVDEEITRKILKYYKKEVPEKYLPDIYSKIEARYNGDISKYTEALFHETTFSDQEATLNLLNNFSEDKIEKITNDPAWELYYSFRDTYSDPIYSKYQTLTHKNDSINRLYMEARMKFEDDKVFYPDANFTLRVGYGKVKGYKPRDAVIYEYQTTLEGIMEKDDPDVYDYRVPEKLKSLYRNKDYGRYEVNGTVPVCFIATNHTSGGNSGSPVVNAQGHLIGVNFDRAWEGVMSDLMYNPDQCRNISLDIRYALFIIDKFAGADYLLDEMTLVD